MNQIKMLKPEDWFQPTSATFSRKFAFKPSQSQFCLDIAVFDQICQKKEKWRCDEADETVIFIFS